MDHLKNNTTPDCVKEASCVNISGMPIIRSAIKKVRKDKTRTKRNKERGAVLKALIKKARIQKTAATLKAVFSALDKAAKVKLIHPNKSARLKSRLSRLLPQTKTVTKSPKK